MRYKCAYCGGEIEVSLPYSSQYIYYKTKRKWFHLNCFCESIKDSNRVSVEDWIKKTDEYVLSRVSMDRIDRLIKRHYNTSVPQYIYVKLDEIYKGSRKGQSQPIPPHELLDILLRKMDYLDKNAEKKQSYDPSFKGIKRFNYDLAVAVNSYEDYKQWQANMLSEQEDNAVSYYNNPSPLVGYDPERYKEEEGDVDFDELWGDD